jgi:hypothetical protein
VVEIVKDACADAGPVVNRHVPEVPSNAMTERAFYCAAA